MRTRPSAPLLLVWLVGAVTFAPVLLGAYVDDDLDLLPVSPAFAGIAHVWDAVRLPFWGDELGYWRPLTSLVMALGHWIGQGHPWPTHAAALAVHLAGATAAFAILRRLQVERAAAALAAAFFAVHPCQVESVAWVAALGDPLAGTCTLFAVLGWLRWRQGEGPRLPWPVWLAVALALASKESGLGALGWLLALDLVLRGEPDRPGRSRLAAWTGIAVVVAAWLVLRMLVFADVRAGFDRASLDTGAHGLHAVVLRAHLALGFLALPTGWLGFTPYRWIPPDTAGLLRASLPLVLLLLPILLAAASALRAQRRIAGLGALGAVAAIAPATLLPEGLGPWPLVDRYAYLLVFGFALVLVGSGRCRLWLGCLLVVVCAVASATLVPLWRTHAAVVRRALADCPRHPEPHFMLAYLERTRAEQSPPHEQRARRKGLARAGRTYERALARLQQPLYAGEHLRAVIGLNARLGRAVVEMALPQRDLDALRQELQSLLESHPGSVQVLLVLGAAHAEAGALAAAEAAWSQALANDANTPQAAFNLGLLYQHQGRVREARAMLERAVALDPRNEQARRLLATLPP